MRIFKLIIFSLVITTTTMAKTINVYSDTLAKKAEVELYTVLKNQTQFVKVHAAEYLIWLGHVTEAKQIFLQEDKLHHQVPKYRVVVWRVLAQTEKNAAAKKVYTDQVFKAFADEAGQDRIHAAETLAKLKLSPLASFPNETNKVLNTEKENLFVYTLWATSYASKDAYKTNKVKFLDLLHNSSKEDLRRISAFILRKEGKLTQNEWTSLAILALAEPNNSAFKKTYLNTAIATSPAKMQNCEIYIKTKEALLNEFEQMPAGVRIETALVLADHGTTSDLPILADFLADKNAAGLYEVDTPLAADIRATAAYAILKIKKRSK